MAPPTPVNGGAQRPMTPQQQQQQQQAMAGQRVVGTPGTPAAGQQGSAAPGGTPGQQPAVADLNRIVLEYLNKKGYTRTEAMLRLESTRSPAPQASNVGPNGGIQTGTLPRPEYSAAGPGVMGAGTPQGLPGTPAGAQIGAGAVRGPGVRLQPSPPSDPPDMYSKAYTSLRGWIDRSLDLYRPELRRLLYPVFVHIFLELISRQFPAQAKQFFEEFSEDHAVLHGKDIESLSAISLPAHVEENELAKAFQTQAYRVAISKTSVDLLLYFLYEIENSGGAIVIRILNQYLDVQVSATRPTIEDTERVLNPDEGLQGVHGSKQLDRFNSQAVRLGPLPMDSEFQKDVSMAAEQKDREQNTNQTDSSVGTTGYNTLSEEFNVKIKDEAGAKDSPARESLPLPKYKSGDIQLEIKKLEDSRSRIKLGVTQSTLPSVCMYTFHNTHGGLNTLDFSDDASLVAGGFSDSFVKIWSLKGNKLSSVVKDDVPSTSKRLIGHAGPVYGLSFSPDNRYLLSSSEDKTVRLWSLDTYTPLVAYKGHNHPVWDVKFSPHGHYFATASHDQTACLWSCDHIYPLRIFAGHLSDVDTVNFHPNGTYVFTGSGDKTCRMWDINRGSSVRVFIGHLGAINCTAVSPDGRWLASAGEDSAIHVWDIGSGRRLKTMKGHGRASIYSLAFSQDGSVLVSAGADNSVRTWDIRRGTHDAGPEPEAFPTDGTKAGNDVINGGSAGDAPDRKRSREIIATSDHMASFHTKRTPVYKVQFTRRNLCLAGGAFLE